MTIALSGLAVGAIFAIGVAVGFGLATLLWLDLANQWERIAKDLMRR